MNRLYDLIEEACARRGMPLRRVFPRALRAIADNKLEARLPGDAALDGPARRQLRENANAIERRPTHFFQWFHEIVVDPEKFEDWFQENLKGQHRRRRKQRAPQREAVEEALASLCPDSRPRPSKPLLFKINGYLKDRGGPG